MSDPLPPGVSEWMNHHHDATPSEVVDAVELDESYREQIEYYCAITRFSIYREQNDADGLRATNVEWSDVAEWDVSSAD